MITIDDIRRPISADLEAFDKFVADNFNAEGEMLQEMLTYALSSRGKGIRPILTMLSALTCTAATYRPDERNCTKRTYLAALMMEMIHTASLIHDDVLDSADERRGKPSVNAKWQSNLAIILGDYILARTMSLGMASAQYDLVTYVGSAMATLCEGEVLQSQHAKSFDTTREDYLDIIYRKTASLFSVCGSVGAISVGASPDKVAAMRTFGKMLGMAFQIVDDILDYTPDNNTGKPAANDLQERKITLPLLEVLERVTPELKSQILSAVERAATDSDAVEFVREQVVKYDGVAAARATLQRFLQRALSELSDLEDTPYRQAMIDLCTFVAERDR